MATTGLVAMIDVKRHLNLDLSDTSVDTELQGFLDAAKEFAEWVAGPIVAAPVFETHTIGRNCSRIALRTVPVLSIQTILEFVGPITYSLTSQPRGASVDNYGYSLDIPEAGIIVRRDLVGTEMPFWGDTVTVAYTAGRATIPATVRMACLEDIRGLWQDSQQGGNPRYGEQSQGGGAWTVPPHHSFPQLAACLEPLERVHGIA